MACDPTKQLYTLEEAAKILGVAFHPELVPEAAPEDRPAPLTETNLQIATIMGLSGTAEQQEQARSFFNAHFNFRR